jgi:hypothetical protein
MTDMLHYGPGPTATADAARTAWPRLAGFAFAFLSALVPTLAYLIGLGLHSADPGTCDNWTGCSASARDQWGWEHGWWPVCGVALGVFVGWVGLVWRPLMGNANVRRVASVLGLVLLVPVTALFGLVASATWNATCSPNSFLCFSGPAAALAFGSPGVLTGALSVLMLLGLIGRDRRAGRVCGTLGLVVCSGLLLAAVAGFMVAIPV